MINQVVDYQKSFWKNLFTLPTKSNKKILFIPLIGIIIFFITQTISIGVYSFYKFTTLIEVREINELSPTLLEETKNNFINLLDSDFQLIIIIYSLIQIILFLLLIRHTRKKYDPLFANFSFSTLKTKSTIYALSLIFFSIGFVTVVFIFFNFLAQNSSLIRIYLEHYQKTISSLISTNNSFIYQLISLAILVPLAEELLFRGLIQNSLNFVVGKGYSILLTALIFAIFHGNLVQGIYTFMLGFLISFVYSTTNSLSLAVVMHMLFNLVGGIFSSIFDENIVFQIILLLLSLVSMLLLPFAYRHFKSLLISVNNIEQESCKCDILDGHNNNDI